MAWQGVVVYRPVPMGEIGRYTPVHDPDTDALQALRLAVSAITPEGELMPATPTKAKPKAKKVAAKAVPAVTAPPPLDPSVLSDALLAVYEKSREIDALRVHLDTLVSECDDLVHEAVDEGERYRDIAAAAGRTVPWVQMSLRRVAGVPTHPGAPLPDTAIRRRRAS